MADGGSAGGSPSRFARRGEQGPPGPPGAQGPPGPGHTTTATAGANISALHAVAVAADGLAYYADKDDLSGDRVVGVAQNSALTGEPLTIATDGQVMQTAAIWTPGPLYVGDDGALVSTPPDGVYLLQIATALTVDRLQVRSHQPIYLA